MKYSIRYGTATIPDEIYVDGVIEPKDDLILKSQMVVALDKTNYKPVAFANTGQNGEFYFRLDSLNTLTVLCFDKTGTYSVSAIDNVTPAIKTYPKI